MNKTIFLIGIGGLIGSIARYLTSTYMAKIIPGIFPYGTFAVNIVGCLLIGILIALSEKGNILSPEWRIFLTTGFCGGFTTFSTFSHESIKLMETGAFFHVSMYVGASVLLGFAATYLGIILIKSL